MMTSHIRSHTVRVEHWAPARPHFRLDWAMIIAAGLVSLLAACSEDRPTANDTADHSETGDADPSGADSGDSDSGSDNQPGGACGDGGVDPDEECDDGDSVNDDECTNACTLPTCGDGITQVGEECDDGNNSNEDSCVEGCITATCGDGYVGPGEGCDDGDIDDTDSCPTTCEPACCGDGIVWAGEEACDDGDAENTDACLDTCEAASCGDGFVWADQEECDDGNIDNTDDCVSMCLAAVCGDGFLWASEEICDDGNIDPGDGCDDMCQHENCWSFTNTNQEDLMGVGWFDACVDAIGDNVQIIVKDVDENIVYQATGAKVGPWTYSQLTSTANVSSQHNVHFHDRVISLDNGDLLRISGKNATNGNCGGSLGNGYVIIVYGDPPDDLYFNGIKLLIAPYRNTVSINSPRGFGEWTPGGELSWGGGGGMSSCFSIHDLSMGPALTPLFGSVEVRVF